MPTPKEKARHRQEFEDELRQRYPALADLPSSAFEPPPPPEPPKPQDAFDSFFSPTDAPSIEFQNALDDLSVPGVLDEFFGSPEAQPRTAFDEFFGPVAAAPIGPRGIPTPPANTLGEAALRLIEDQLEPLNLALLAASFPVGRFAFTATAKLLGAPLLRSVGFETAAQVTPNLLTTAGEVTGRYIAPRAAEGAAINLMFSAAELIEEPPEDSSRIGEFFRALAFNELIDAGLIGIGIPFARLGRLRKEALRTFELSQREGASIQDAAADALISKIEILRAEGVAPELIDSILKAAHVASSEPVGPMIERLQTEYAPQVYAAATQLGLDPDLVARGLSNRINATMAENAVRPGAFADDPELENFMREAFNMRPGRPTPEEAATGIDELLAVQNALWEASGGPRRAVPGALEGVPLPPGLSRARGPVEPPAGGGRGIPPEILRILREQAEKAPK